MALIQINHNPAPATLRWFGALLGLFLAIIGALAHWRYGLPTVAVALWISAAVVVPCYYLLPAIQKKLYLGWMYAVYPLGFAMSYVLLAVIFYLVITPIGLVMRLCGHDPMQRAFDRQAASYWSPHRASKNSNRYLQQF